MWCAQKSMTALSDVLYAWSINNVHWKKDPELARKIRGADGEEGFAKGSDGMSLYAYLRERGSALQPHVQSEMETEWPGVYAEAHSKSQSKTIFTDVSTSDAVLGSYVVCVVTSLPVWRVACMRVPPSRSRAAWLACATRVDHPPPL